MSFIIASEKQYRSWNRYLKEHSLRHVLQTWEFGNVRSEAGTQCIRAIVQDNKTIRAIAQMSIHPIPKLPWSIGYIPRGPVWDQHSETTLFELLTKLREYAQKNNIAFIKIEPNVTYDTNYHVQWKTAVKAFGMKNSPNPRFMNATSMIDLSYSEEQLLQNCRKNTRYYIRKSQKENIVIREADNKKDLGVFYSLLEQTANRQNFQLAARPLSYFEAMWETFRNNINNPHRHIRLFFAEIDHQPVATMLNLYSDQIAYYPYGASSQAAHHTAATEGLMWHTITEAKRSGCQHYDLWGVLSEKNTHHPYWGYTFFKQGFGGNTVHYLGSFDFPTMPGLYVPLQVGEKARRLALTFRKRLHR